MTNGPLSPVEGIKERSNYLRGTLAQSFADPVTGAIADDDLMIIKFHGSYQQDDRDVREERRQQKLEPLYSFMLRARVPGGVCSPAQWLVFDDLAQRYGNHTLRLTTRQAFQLHGVYKENMKATIQAVVKSGLDSIAACGDVNRNVMSSANPVETRAHARVYEYAKAISEHLLPKTSAYYELWLNKEKVAGNDEEPVYGATYLPRKFKTAVAIPPINDVDVFAHDLGFIAILEGEQLQGFNVSAGGGMGTTHNDAETFPRLADVLGFITPDKVLAVAEAVVTTQRDWGNRSVRKLARLKYTIDRVGVEAFRAEVEKRSGVRFAPARDFQFVQSGDQFGWIWGADGYFHLTLFIENGRIADRDNTRLLTGLREIAQVHQGDFRLTANQNLVIARVPASQKDRIDALVKQYGLDYYETASPLRRDAMACVSLPTCSLAMAESERYLPSFIDKLEQQLTRHGIAQNNITVRMTGCPNGCARPYLAEIGFIGKAAGRYNLYLGANRAGTRLNKLFRENIDEPTILATLDPILARYAIEKNAQEDFGDFVIRSGIVAAVTQGREVHG